MAPNDMRNKDLVLRQRLRSAWLGQPKNCSAAHRRQDAPRVVCELQSLPVLALDAIRSTLHTSESPKRIEKATCSARTKVFSLGSLMKFFFPSSACARAPSESGVVHIRRSPPWQSLRVSLHRTPSRCPDWPCASSNTFRLSRIHNTAKGTMSLSTAVSSEYRTGTVRYHVQNLRGSSRISATKSSGSWTLSFDMPLLACITKYVLHANLPSCILPPAPSVPLWSLPGRRGSAPRDLQLSMLLFFPFGIWSTWSSCFLLAIFACPGHRIFTMSCLSFHVCHCLRYLGQCSVP